MAECKFISCFSYKGGAGRSTLAINVVPYLVEKLGATEDHPLVLIDMDVDSCGITYLFNLHKDERIKKDNVQNWFDPTSFNLPLVDDDDEIESAKEHNMLRKLFPVGAYFNTEPGAVLCLPSNPGSKFSKGNNYDSEPSDNLAKFKKSVKDIAVGVLFDSAVGDQLGAIWSNHYSKYILCCMRPTKQFRAGTKRFFELFDKKMVSKNIIVVPNVVPTDKLSIADADDSSIINQYPDHAKREILKDFGSDSKSGSNNKYILDLLDGDKFGVPKVDRFMWQEGVLRNEKNLSELERVALKRYAEIATIIANAD